MPVDRNILRKSKDETLHLAAPTVRRRLPQAMPAEAKESTTVSSKKELRVTKTVQRYCTDEIMEQIVRFENTMPETKTKTIVRDPAVRPTNNRNSTTTHKQ